MATAVIVTLDRARARSATRRRGTRRRWCSTAHGAVSLLDAPAAARRSAPPAAATIEEGHVRLRPRLHARPLHRRADRAPRREHRRRHHAVVGDPRRQHGADCRPALGRCRAGARRRRRRPRRRHRAAGRAVHRRPCRAGATSRSVTARRQSSAPATSGTPRTSRRRRLGRRRLVGRRAVAQRLARPAGDRAEARDQRRHEQRADDEGVDEHAGRERDGELAQRDRRGPAPAARSCRPARAPASVTGFAAAAPRPRPRRPAGACRASCQIRPTTNTL